MLNMKNMSLRINKTWYLIYKETQIVHDSPSLKITWSWLYKIIEPKDKLHLLKVFLAATSHM